ncbi:MAG: hypothetical protein ABSD92_00785 [Candidatus Bathyarchaeia archaeon]|jgi:hypothetical protein
MSEEKFDNEGFEKLKAAFNEYEAEQKVPLFKKEPRGQRCVLS